MEDELYHHGIKGQRWGVRRYQNEDGSYTKEGLARIRKMDSKYERRHKKEAAIAKSYRNDVASKLKTKIEKTTNELKEDVLLSQKSLEEREASGEFRDTARGNLDFCKQLLDSDAENEYSKADLYSFALSMYDYSFPDEMLEKMSEEEVVDIMAKNVKKEVKNFYDSGEFEKYVNDTVKGLYAATALLYRVENDPLEDIYGAYSDAKTRKKVDDIVSEYSQLRFTINV